ncbi:MAG TPA: rhodanese-like domain-containing protein [Candidatus Limnocylindria bacterium]|nr:rhodanese-like domain-containing protein [Candidatus Limnocylindria bacterium]
MKWLYRAAVLIRQFVVEGLGHISALVADDARGVAAVIDPRRDVDVYLRAAAERGWRISHVLETHLHNDYISGGVELAALTGARHVIGAGAEAAYEHQPMRDGDAIDVGSLRFASLETPGHTPEHVAYTLADLSRTDDPLAVFTGGSLLVGAIGRTDLLGEVNAQPYARQMFHSLHDKLLAQQDYVGVHPTHGGGSLCSKDISSTPSSSIGYERRHNELLTIPEIDEFCRALLYDQPGYPRYFARMRPINKAGAPPLGTISGPRSLSVSEVQALVAADALVIDARPYPDYATGHLPGAFAIPAGSSFGTWLGWVVPDGRPLVFVLESADDWDDLLRQALRIGYDDVRGHLASVADWRAAGLPLETGKLATLKELAASRDAAGPDAPLILDVRQHYEWVEGHIPGSVHLMGGDLPDRLGELPRDRPIVTICRSANRSAIAAGVLLRAGFTDVTWVDAGVPAWRRAGLPIERGD